MSTLFLFPSSPEENPISSYIHPPFNRSPRVEMILVERNLCTEEKLLSRFVHLFFQMILICYRIILKCWLR